MNAETIRQQAQHRNRRERRDVNLVGMYCKVTEDEHDDLKQWASEYRISQGELVGKLIQTHRRQRAKKLAA